MKKVMVVLVALICLFVMPLSVAQAEGGDDFTAANQRFRYVNVGPNIDSVAYDTELNGNYNWHFFIINDSDEAVSSPTISVKSTLDPVSFPNVDGFPATWSLESLGPGEAWILPDLTSDYAVAFTLGYNCSRTMEPLEIPPEGGVQTVTIKVKPVDERYQSHPFMQIHLSGSVVEGSNTQPDGAETMLTPDEIYWSLSGWELGVEYTFSVDLKVENPWGVSFVHKPSVSIYVEFAEILDEKAGTSTTTIYDEILDGFITYSVPVEGNWSRNIFNCWMVEMELSQIIAPIDIDIKPGSDPNSINLGSKGVVPVAVLTTDDFDASIVDADTVEFAGASPVRWVMCDVDDDGDIDMLFHFKTQDLDLAKDSTEATLTGKTADGTSIIGTDTVNIVPKKKGK